MEMLELQNLHKTFNPGTVNEKVALNGVSLTMEAGDFATIVGSSSMPSPAASLRMKAAFLWAGRTSRLRRSTSAARSSATCSRTRSRARPPI